MFSMLASLVLVAAALPRQAAGDLHVAVFRPDLSIVTETVAIDLQVGSNTLRLDFVRGNADLTTLQVFPLDHASGVRIVSQTRRDELGNTVFLEVESTAAVRERFELRYVARGYSAAPSYVATYDAARRTLDVTQELEIANDSGERLTTARVDAMFGDVRTVGSQPVTHGRAADPQGGLPPGLPSEPLVKDAAEHTVVEFGTGVVVADGSLLRRQVFALGGLGTELEHRFRADEAGGRVTRRIKVKNTSDAGLGGKTLQPGRWTIFERDSNGVERFTAAVELGSLAPNSDLELGLTVAEDFFVERERKDHQRSDLVFGEYNRALVSFSETEAWQLKIRNHSGEARTLIVHEVVGGTDTFEVEESSVPATRKDRNLLEFKVEAPGNGEVILTYRVKKSNLRVG